MPLQIGEKGYYTFVRGLITEASPFTMPENASSDEYNFELLVNGARRRRLGIDYEDSATAIDITGFAGTHAITAHKWQSVGGDADTNFIVVQEGNTLHFFDHADPLYSGERAFTFDITTFKVSGTSDATVAGEPIAVASGKGYLFVVQKHCEPFYLVYDSVNDKVDGYQIGAWERLFDRLSSDFVTSPTTLSDDHKFDLVNNGWSPAAITAYNGVHSYYPNLTRIYGSGYYVDVTTGVRTYSYSEVNNYDWGNTPAPNGHIIVNIFNTGALIATSSVDISSFTYTHATPEVEVTTGAAHGLSVGDPVTINNNASTYDSDPGAGVTSNVGSLNGTYIVQTVPSTTKFTITKEYTNWASWISQYVSKGTCYINVMNNPQPETTDLRFTAVAFFAGRVWFGGCPSDRLASRVYYTQILDSDSKIGLCYQNDDPTKAEEAQVVATDGGVVVLPEMTQLRGLMPYGDKILLLGANGIWAVAGGSDSYFKADSYIVQKVMSLNIPEGQKGTLYEGVPLVLAEEGVYAIGADQVSGNAKGESMTADTIQTYWRTIPRACLNKAGVAYDDVSKRLVISFSTSSSTPHKHDRVLIFDVRLKAWFRYSIPAATPYVTALIALDFNADATKEIKFITIDNGTDELWFSEFNNTDWKDWYTYDTAGADAAAYMVTRYELGQGPERTKWPQYLHLFLKRTETTWTSDGSTPPNGVLSPQSSCQVQALWDFHSTTAGGKITTAFEGYRHRRNFVAPDSLPAAFDPGYDVVVTRNRLRGNGRSIQLKFSTQSGKDCYLYGWHFRAGSPADL